MNDEKKNGYFNKESSRADAKGKFVTLSPRLTIAPPNELCKVIGEDSKITMLITDYEHKDKEGKATVVRYNLEMKDFYEIEQYCKYLPTLNYSVRCSKFLGMYTQKSGRFAGMAQSNNLYINKQLVDDKGKPKNYPWFISIDNGYAKPGKDGGLDKSSYIQTGKTFLNVSNKDMMDMCEGVRNYIDAFVRSAPVVESENAKIKILLEQESNRTKEKETEYQAEAPAYQEVPYQNAPVYQGSPVYQDAPAYQAQPSAPAAPDPYQAAPQQAAAPAVTVPNANMYQVQLSIVSDFFSLENGVCATCASDSGSQFPVIFDVLTNEIKAAQKNKTPINLILYMSNDANGQVTHCMGPVV